MNSIFKMSSAKSLAMPRLVEVLVKPLDDLQNLRLQHSRIVLNIGYFEIRIGYFEIRFRLII